MSLDAVDRELDGFGKSDAELEAVRARARARVAADLASVDAALEELGAAAPAGRRTAPSVRPPAPAVAVDMHFDDAPADALPAGGPAASAREADRDVDIFAGLDSMPPSTAEVSGEATQEHALPEGDDDFEVLVDEDAIEVLDVDGEDDADRK